MAAFTQSGQWPAIWSALFRLLAAPSTPTALYADGLHALRILSRDSTHLDQTTEAQFNALLHIANLGAAELSADERRRLPDAVAAEALKCMCNLVYQSKRCQDMCLTNTAIAGIVRRLRTYKDANVAYDLQYFDMKLLFIITGRSEDARTKLRYDYYGLVYLPETLELIMQQHSGDVQGCGGGVVGASLLRLADKQVDLVCEILKTLFNITYRTETAVPTEEEEVVHLRRLAVCLHDLLRCTALNRDKQTELCSHVVNLLTNVPTACYAELVLRDGEQRATHGSASAQVARFDGHDVAVLDVLLAFLRQRLSGSAAKRLAEQRVLLSPVLMALIKCVRCAAVQRRYVRTVVLPPLRDVQQRPEVGDELRNQLCRLLTSPATDVRDLAAELLFVLCKENVWRMTKYTGYGNAAGMFANRGLLGGGPSGSGSGSGDAVSGAADYSSDSEDSDTEEYKRVCHEINPVLGCTEPPRHGDPFAGMSEEQKEHEAMKLVQLMEQLNRAGVVQPCRVGEDGRPVPVEHILELQEALPEQQAAVKHKT